MDSQSVSRRVLLLGGTGTVATAGGVALAGPAEAAMTKAQLTAKVSAYQRSRGGTVAVAVFDRRNNTYWTYNNTWRNETLSTVKVLIMATVLRRCQERKVNLTPTQRSQAFAMITRSDNTATNALLTWAGITHVRRVALLYNMRSTVVQGGTTAGAASWWGYSTTVAYDQAMLVAKIIWGFTDILTTPNREYLKSLMRQVIPAQRWGVSVPPLPSNNQWTTKNGWGPRTGGYRLNSVRYIYGDKRDYTAAILTRAPQGFAYGKATINGVSRIVYDALATPLT